MRKVALALLVLCLLSWVASTAALAKAQRVVVAAWGAQAEKETIDALAEKFNAEHPDITVEITYPAGGYEDKIITMVAGGAAPDVVQVQNGWGLSQFAVAGVIQPLDTYATRSKVRLADLISPKLVGELSFDGKTYAYPKGFTTKAMAVNKDLFDGAGMALPTAQWSLSDYRQNAMKLTNETKQQYGSMILWDQLWMYVNGGRIFADDNQTVLIDSDAAAIGLQFTYDMNQDPRATVQSDSVWSDQSQNLWYSGRVGMWPDMGAWTLPNFKTRGVSWNYYLTPLPHKTTAPGSVPMAVTGFAMTTTTTVPEAAWEWIRWVSFSKSAQDVIATGAMLPGLRSSIKNWLDMGYPGGDSFIVEMEYAAPEPANSFLSKMWDIIGEEWGKAAKGTITYKVANAEVKRRLEAVVAEARN